jgi:hypothetical protein
VVIVLLLSWTLELSAISIKAPFHLAHSGPYYEALMTTDTIVKKQLFTVIPFNLELIPPSSGVSFYKDGIIFLSNSKNYGKMIPDHVSFGTNVVSYGIIADSALGKEINAFSPLFSFPIPCEAITFTSDFNTMYFTWRTNKENNEKIFQAKYSSEGNSVSNWTINPNPMTFCNDNSVYTHPALSSDEKFIVFASDRPGSYGGTDLFITSKENDNWSDPKNLGETINTKGNELYPFLDSKNNLYFSSDGLKGFGGYDIFVCRYRNGNWDAPINLSNTINTENDDIAFTLNNKDESISFYTIRQKSGNKKMQLYRITRNEKTFKDDFKSLSDIFISKDFPGDNLNEIKTEALHPNLNANPSKSDSIKDIKKEVKKTEVPVKTVVNSEKIAPTVAVVQSIKPVSKADSSKSIAKVETANTIDVVVYRVQFLTSTTPNSKSQIPVDGKNFNTFEYFFNGAYRLCVGEFSALAAASEFQIKVRKSGYSQAFVVAFKNNKRSTDPALFK